MHKKSNSVYICQAKDNNLSENAANITLSEHNAAINKIMCTLLILFSRFNICIV